jgi:hypothetical protein
MKPFALTALIGLISAVSYAAEPQSKPRCAPPPAGPIWLQDFTPAQKAELKLKWEPSEETADVSYKIEGKYHEPLDTSRVYSRYKHVSEIEAEETWICNPDLTSKFKAIHGEVESELQWKSETVDTKETFEGENRFTIHAPNDYRHVKHESERTFEVRTETTQKDGEEETEWKQTWEANGVPVIRGKSREKVTEKYFLAAPPVRKLASPILIPGYDAVPLQAGVHMMVEKETDAKFNGPIDPISVLTKQIVKQIKDEKVVETREATSEQKTSFLYDSKAKKYDFLLSTELYDEKVVNPEQGFKVRYARFETWTNPEGAPTKSSFWKETYRKSKFGGSAELTLTSKGHGLLPKLTSKQALDGTYNRITDYSSAGKIVRFLVLYFPEGEKENQTLIDLHFSDAGELREFSVPDSEINAIENPLKNPAALYALQQRIQRMKDLEAFATLKDLPSRTVRDGDYPVIYQPATDN